MVVVSEGDDDDREAQGVIGGRDGGLSQRIKESGRLSSTRNLAGALVKLSSEGKWWEEAAPGSLSVLEGGRTLAPAATKSHKPPPDTASP